MANFYTKSEMKNPFKNFKKESQRFQSLVFPNFLPSPFFGPKIRILLSGNKTRLTTLQ